MKRIIKCAECGSTDLVFDGSVAWNYTKQCFELLELQDEYPWCNNCCERMEELWEELPTEIKII